MTSRAATSLALEHLIVADAVVSVLRHDARNRLTAINNALTYVRRRTATMSEIGDDDRIHRFFDLCRRETQSLSEALGPLDPVATVDPRAHDVGPGLARAFRGTPSDLPDVYADPTATTLLLATICALFDDPEGVVVAVENTPQTLRLRLEGRPAPRATAAEHAAFATHELTLAIARRSAHWCGGELSDDVDDDRRQVEITLPRPAP